MADPVVSAGAVELVVLGVGALGGATGLWRWVASRVARADAEVAQLRVDHLTALAQIAQLAAEVADLRARLASAEEMRQIADRLRGERDAALRRVRVLERRILTLGGEVTEPEDDCAPSGRWSR